MFRHPLNILCPILAYIPAFRTKEYSGLRALHAIKKLPEDATENLLKIFNSSFNNWDFPGEWNESFTILIPKPEDKGFSRPISVASNVSKLFKRIIQTRLYWWAENNNVIPQFQTGFKEGLSGLKM